jgi:3-hydroxyisobutyrate dehydrogenase
LNDKAITVGFIGLGSQGGPMARRIVEAGYPLILWARRPEALAAFADTKASTAPSIADLAAHCDHVGICVFDDSGVRDVCGVLLPAMRPGSIVAIHSTILPDTCLDLARQAEARGIALIDAPVSGGGHGAAAGTLTIMVGGTPEALAQARPVFETFAGLISHLGNVGAGQLAKLVNNTLMAANMGVADAALAAGAKLGIERGALAELINASSGRSYGFAVRARFANPAMFRGGAKLLSKDVALLGTVLGDDRSFTPLRDAAGPFLARALESEG